MPFGTHRLGLSLAAGLFILIGIPGALAILMDVPWDPGVYVGWNDIIVQGSLDRLWDTAPREMPEHDNFCFRGQAGVVTVTRVIYNKTDRVLTCGDTLSFFHRTASTSEPKGDVIRGISETGKPIDIPIGEGGYFALGVGKYGIRPGWFFCVGKERAKEVDAFLASLAADSAATVTALQQRHSGLRFTFRPVGQ